MGDMLFRRGKQPEIFQTVAPLATGPAIQRAAIVPHEADLETKVILKQCIRSRSALAELKQAGEGIQNQTVLVPASQRV